MDEKGEKKFNFLFYMNDPSYDNDDNIYGKFIYHMYTNMDGPDDIEGKRSTFNDIEVPLVLCNTGDLEWRTGGIRYYCPKYDQNSFLHGGFSADKYNWHRLIIHLCDETKRDDCVSREDSVKYFENNIIGLETWSFEASIKEDFSQKLYTSEKSGKNKT